MTAYFAYVRVSTPRQGYLGVSLTEQRESIIRFSTVHNLTIAVWFEEIETAAKSGRKVFKEMISRLERGEATGLILHKIDRGARNLHDWAALGDLIDRGVSIRFAHDDLRMDSRGGRLAADIQAVVAADYVRNLREEIRKGISGRLRQGLYPFSAPLGYLDQGAGRAKVPDPERAPFIVEAFRLYASGMFSQREVAKLLAHRGFVNHNGRTPCFKALNLVLRNPFYMGVMRVSGTTYPGIHEPLISEDLFNRVQAVSTKRIAGKRRVKHDFLYRRFLRCTCERHLTGERQKGHVYYRCHQGCLRGTLKESDVEAKVVKSLQELSMGSAIELTALLTPIAKRHGTSVSALQSAVSSPAELFATSPISFRRKMLHLLATHCLVRDNELYVHYRAPFSGFVTKSSSPLWSHEKVADSATFQTQKERQT